MLITSEYNQVETSSDGTITQPNLHDYLLVEYTFKNNHLSLIFTAQTNQMNLLFPNIQLVNLTMQKEMMVFRISCFDLTNLSDEYFYLKQAVQCLGYESVAQILTDFGQPSFLNYIEGLGGTITLISDKPLYTQKF